MIGEVYAVPGWPVVPPTPFGQATLIGRRLEKLHVPGQRFAERHRWVRFDGTPMIGVRSWFVPQLDWLMEFRADCEVFEKRGSRWHAERDGVLYEIPAAWDLREESREDLV